MKSSNLSSPIHEIPIGDDDMCLVGRISFVWGQLDFLVETILMNLANFNLDLMNLYFGSKTIAPKLDAIECYAKNCEGEVKQALRDMLKATRSCNSDRNLVVHGKWGWHWDEKSSCWRAGAFDIAKRRWFYVSQLKSLHERMIVACDLADVAFYLLAERTSPPPNRNHPFVVSAVDPVFIKAARPNFSR